jgi:competence protein ComEC
MTNLIFTVWNVEHGSSVFVQTPNGRKVFLDCGSSSGFSPAKEVNSTSEKKKLDFLVITHPHQDHITDILNIENRFKIKVLRRNKVITKDVMLEDNEKVFDPPNDKIIEKYFELADRFVDDVTPENDPSLPTWGNGCTFHSFNNNDLKLGVNNLSVATFIHFGNETIFQGGDIEEKGWLELLKNNDFKEHLKKTTILLASHHGNDSGFCKDLFNYFTPKITIFSAGSFVDDISRKKYEVNTKGMIVRKRSGSEEKRWVLTTRHDGHIKMVISPTGDIEPKITID